MAAPLNPPVSTVDRPERTRPNSSGAYRRGVAAASLVATAALSGVSVMLQPELGEDPAAQLAAIAAAGTGATASVVAFLLAQLPFIGAVLGVAHLLRTRTPLLSNVAGTLGVVGAFGHTVFGGLSLVYLSMAGDPANRQVYAALMARLGDSPVMLFSLAGLVGTVLSVVLLAAGLWRSRIVPRWVPAVLWLFVVVEFAGSGFSRQASYLASVLLLVAFGALAVRVQRSDSAW